MLRFVFGTDKWKEDYLILTTVDIIDNQNGTFNFNVNRDDRYPLIGEPNLEHISDDDVSREVVAVNLNDIFAERYTINMVQLETHLLIASNNIVDRQLAESMEQTYPRILFGYGPNHISIYLDFGIVYYRYVRITFNNNGSILNINKQGWFLSNIEHTLNTPFIDNAVMNNRQTIWKIIGHILPPINP